MRRALLVLTLLAVAGCDSDGTTGPGPDPDPVPVTLTYRVSINGDVFDASVTYTNASGATVNEAVDFSRASTYTREVELPAGTTGPFALAASAVIDQGQRVSVSILAAQSDDPTNEAASDSDIAVATTDGDEVSASAQIDLPVLFAAPATE